MQNVNPLHTSKEEKFVLLNSDLKYFYGVPRHVESGAIILCQAGEADVSIDMHNEKIKCNTQVFLLPKVIMMLSNVSPDFQVTVLAFSHDLFDEAAYPIDMEFFHYIHKYPVYHHNPEQADAANVWLKSTFYIYQDKENLFRNTIIKNRLQNVFLEIYDKVKRIINLQTTLGSIRKEELFYRFLTLVHEYAPTERELSFYAGKLCVSIRYLSAITRSIANASAKEIIDRMVVLQIKVMLQSTDMSVQEIADELNFYDQSYLGHYFKKHTGESPTVYRSHNMM